MSRAPGVHKAAGLAVIVLMGSACASLGGGDRTTTSDPGIREQLFKIQKDNARMLDKLDEIERTDRQDGVRATCAEAVAKMDEIERRILIVEEQTLSTQARIDVALAVLRSIQRSGTGLTGSGYATPGEPVVISLPPADAGMTPARGTTPHEMGAGPVAPAGVAPVAGAASATDLFNAAYADYAQNKLDLALAGFEGARNADPTGPLAVKAEFWKGETLYLMGRYAEAVPVYDAVIRTDVDGDLVPQAHLKKGLALYEARQTTEGVLELQFVTDTWPESDEARLAREWLKRKGIVSE